MDRRGEAKPGEFTPGQCASGLRYLPQHLSLGLSFPTWNTMGLSPFPVGGTATGTDTQPAGPLGVGDRRGSGGDAGGCG